MKGQTEQLCRSFPKLAKLYESADAGGYDWAIYRSPIAVCKGAASLRAEHGLLLALVDASGNKRDNRFPSRTAALRRSAELARQIGECGEKEHWGGWRLEALIPGEAEKETAGPRKGKLMRRDCLQFCLPIPRKSDIGEREDSAPASKPAQGRKPASPANSKPGQRKPMSAEDKAEAARLQAQSPAAIKLAQEAQAKADALAAVSPQEGAVTA